MIIISIQFSYAQENDKSHYDIIAFGARGYHKMLYDRRQRPQAVVIDHKIHIVFNGVVNEHGLAKPHAITYNLRNKTFSQSVTLPGKASKDHHYGPIIWADTDNYLHVLSGCHKTPGTYVISKAPSNIGNSQMDWVIGEEIAPSLSYPSVSKVLQNQYVIYYRVHEHRSSWTYCISEDGSTNWKNPPRDIVDLNKGDHLTNKPHQEMDEASSYQTYLPSKDGKSIHIAFLYYDDNKKNIPDKFVNPRYGTNKNLGIKYNLYYANVNLENQEVRNFEGELLKTPIDLGQANEKCKIWDTNWKGSGIPPEIILDHNNNPAFLHVLSEETPKDFNYYYIRFEEGQWKKTIIAPSCHKWNNSYLKRDEQGTLRAYLLMDNAFFEHKGLSKFYSHGGGTRIEEWFSSDNGNSWVKDRTLFKAEDKYEGWRFNNIQPIKNKEGEYKSGLIFYGFKEEKQTEVKAFLMLKK